MPANHVAYSSNDGACFLLSVVCFAAVFSDNIWQDISDCLPETSVQVELPVAVLLAVFFLNSLRSLMSNLRKCSDQFDKSAKKNASDQTAVWPCPYYPRCTISMMLLLLSLRSVECKQTNCGYSRSVKSYLY